VREVGGDGIFSSYKLDAAKLAGLIAMQAHAQVLQDFHAVRHQAFAASFVDGRRGTIDHHGAQALAASGDACGKTGRSAADDENVSIERMSHAFCCHLLSQHRYQLSKARARICVRILLSRNI
jgi:phage-related protein